MLCALILAGGSGSRFWPKSTNKKPKQFLSLIDERTMLQITYQLINKFIPKQNIFIVTNNDYVDIVKEQIKDIENINIIIEPCSKNTGPCILLSSLYIKNIYDDANLICVSSDNYIQDVEKYVRDLKLANNFITKNKEAIVTIGIRPTRPETQYGYIKYIQYDKEILKVEKFVEKPNLKLANEYLKNKGYLWNAGIFAFNINFILKEFEKNLPSEFKLLLDLPKYDHSDYMKILTKNYSECKKISIDYAIMEKSNNIYTIPSNIRWDDLGTWQSLERYLPKKNSNIIKGNAKVINSKNNIIYANNKKIIFLNVDNIFCIDSDDVIIVGNKNSISEVHNLNDYEN